MEGLEGTKIFSIWFNLLSNFWFVPALIVLGAAGLWYAMNFVDSILLSGEIRLWWVYSGGIDGARGILTAIATASITVAGTIFSITIVVLSLASRQFGSRILRSFIANRGNQIVLGTYLGTFIYCLLSLTTIRGQVSTGSVPQAAITFALFLAIASIGVLVYFINHITTSIQSYNVVKSVAEELFQTIARIFPEKLHKEKESEIELHDNAALDGYFDRGADFIQANHSGYVQSIDYAGIMDVAVKNEMVVHLRCRSGTFVYPNATLAALQPKNRVSDKIKSDIEHGFHLGVDETAEQDIGYSLERLVQIAVAALSPSYNDPFTAITCLDWLGVIFIDIVRRKFPSPHYYDSRGKIRIVTQPIEFAKFVEIAFSKFHHAIQKHLDVLIRLIDTIANIARSVARKEDARALINELYKIREYCFRSFEGSELKIIEQHYEETLNLLNASLWA